MRRQATGESAVYSPVRPPKLFLLGALAGLLLTLSPAGGQSLGDVRLHGFGGWAYGKTDGNRYLVGNEEGNYENVELGLNVTAPIHDRVTLVAQVFFRLEDQIVEEVEHTEVRLDYTFAEIFFDDLAKLRVGRVKHPYGIYTEVVDVGTVRPFYTLPQSIYGPQGIVTEAYNGIGITGRKGGGSEGWGLQYDVYGGQLETELIFPGILSPTGGEDVLQPEIRAPLEIEDMIGVRLNVLTPIDGFLFGVSAYGGDTFTVLDPDISHEVLGAHLDYTGDRLWIRAEWADFDRDDFTEDNFYVELAYKLTSRWQIAGRYEDFSAELPGIDTSIFPDFFTQVLEHQDVVFGVNYWFNANFVLRLNYHLNEGNRFAFPANSDEILESLLNDDLEDRTDLFVFGMQFSF